MKKSKRPQGGAWRDAEADDLPRACSLCSSTLLFRVRIHPEDAPEVNLWTEEHGFMEVIVGFCLTCDPNLAEVLHG